MLRLTQFVLRHRGLVIGVWILLAMLGIVATGPLNDRWQQDFSTPGQPAFEADKRTDQTLGSGRQYPITLTYTARTPGAISDTAIRASVQAVAAESKGSRYSARFNTGKDYYSSED